MDVLSSKYGFRIVSSLEQIIVNICFSLWHEIVHMIQSESGKNKEILANSGFAPDICFHEPVFVKTDDWSPVFFIKRMSACSVCYGHEYLFIHY